MIFYQTIEFLPFSVKAVGFYDAKESKDRTIVGVHAFVLIQDFQLLPLIDGLTKDVIKSNGQDVEKYESKTDNKSINQFFF